MSTGAVTEYSAATSPGTSFVYSLDGFRVTRPVMLLDAVPTRLDAGLELLGARVIYLHRASDGAQVNGEPGALCTKDYPPRTFGPTEPAPSLHLQPGDIIVFTFWVKAHRPGDWVADGVRVRYRDQGETRQLQQAYTSLKLHVRDQPAQYPTGVTPCEDIYDPVWFGVTPPHPSPSS